MDIYIYTHTFGVLHVYGFIDAYVLLGWFSGVWVVLHRIVAFSSSFLFFSLFPIGVL